MIDIFLALDAKQETGLDFKTIGHYTTVSILAAIAIFGVGYMIRTNCKIREKCCKCCVDLEKEDKNLDYGTYYDADGERRQDVMEVTSDFHYKFSIISHQSSIIIG